MCVIYQNKKCNKTLIKGENLMNTLEQNITEFGLLAEMAYLNLQDNIDSKINTFVNKKGISRTLSGKYEVLDYIDIDNGLQAYCLKNENNEYIIAFRGAGMEKIQANIKKLRVSLNK